MAAEDCTTKTCTRCGEVKPSPAFSISDKGRRRAICKSCRAFLARKRRAENPEWALEIGRRYRAKHSKEHFYNRARRTHLSVTYGISIDEYESMLKAQNGLCAICRKPEVTVDRRRPGEVRKLAVDHCHTTGKIRGLLCAKCNAAIGHFKESIESIRSALAYLEKSYS